MVSGAKRPYLFRDLSKTSMAQNPFRPKQECKKLFSTFTLTDEPWEQKIGGVALDYLGTIWWSFLCGDVLIGMEIASKRDCR